MCAARNRMTRKPAVHYASVMLALVMLVDLAAAQTGVDTTRAKQKRMPANTTFEKVVSFPGQLAYAPVRYTVLGLGYTGVYLVETGVVEKVVNVVGGAGVVPVYAPRTGAGLRYTVTDCLIEDAALVTTATSWVDSRQLYSVEWSKVPLGAGFTSEYTIRYRSLTEEAFFGIGKESRESDDLSYSAEDILFEFSLHRKLSPYFRSTLDIGISNSSIFDGRNGVSPTITDVYTEQTLPGLKEKNRFQGTEFALFYDNTKDAAHPTAGWLGKAAAALFNDIHDDDLSFWKASLDLTQHIHLFNDRTLVLRGAGEMTQALEGSNIPFYHLAEIGSYGTVRGFSRGRFRDNDHLIGSAEYRYPVWIPWAKIVDAVVFVDGGQVAHNILEEGSINEWKIGYGGGFRFYNATNLVAKTEIAFSEERFRFYFTLNTP